MKKYQILFIIFAGIIIPAFIIPDTVTKYQVNIQKDCDSIPVLNKQIITFVTEHIKKKVGTGECWDLAAEALNFAGAKWNGQYVFGKPVDYKNECVYPGDIIQFKNVKLHYELNGKIYDESMLHHTAIVYEVKAKGEYMIAHQNNAFSGRKVGVSRFNVKDMKQGKIIIYRPVK